LLQGGASAVAIAGYVGVCPARAFSCYSVGAVTVASADHVGGASAVAFAGHVGVCPARAFSCYSVGAVTVASADCGATVAAPLLLLVVLLVLCWSWCFCFCIILFMHKSSFLSLSIRCMFCRRGKAHSEHEDTAQTAR